MTSHYPRLLFTFLVLLAVSLAVLLAAPISADSHGEDRDSGSQGASDPEPSCPSCIVPPPAPTGFTVTPNGKTTFSVRWNSVSGATKYRLEYQNPGSQQWIRVSDYASGSTRTISGFDCDTAYTFRVRAFGDGDDYTATWGAASTRYATTHLCAPPEPTGFIAEASGKTSIRLNWDYQGGISRYSIDRRPSSTSSWTSVTSSASGSSTSYTVPNLTCNTAYLFRIRAYGDGYSYAAEWSPVYVSYNYVSTELCLASAPRGFTVTANDDSSFNVRWTNVPGANSYLLEYLGPGGPRCPSCPDWVELGTYTSGYTRTIHGFSPGTRYDFRVRAYGDGVNLNSDLGDAATTSATIPLPNPPVPTGLSGYAASQDGDTKIDLSWDPKSGVSRFQVQYRLSTSSRWLTATSNLSGSSTSYTVTGLQCSKEYQFQIRAYGDGSSYASSWGPYTSSPHPSASTELCCATAPRNFTVTANDDDESHSSFNVSWSEVDNADSYLLESMAPAGARCPSCPDWVSEGTFYSRGPHTISGFSPGTRYDFRVRAYGDGVNLNSKLGDAATTSATIPRPVIDSITGLSGYAASQDGDTKIDLSWDPESGVSRYQIQYRLSTSSRWLTATSNLSGSSTSYTVTGLQCSKEYQFQIRAYGDGSSYASSWGPYSSSPYPSASTELCCATAPRNFTVTANDDDESHSSFNVSWSEVDNADSYLLESMAPAGARCPSCPDWVSEGTFYSRGPHTISGFSPGLTYQFRVRAYGDGVNLNSNLGDAATTSATIPRPVIDSITGLTGYAASQDGDTKIDLGWDPESGVSRFQIQYRLSTSSRWLTATSNLSGSSTSYTVTGLQCGKEYQFQIRAYGDGSSYASSWGPYSSSPHPSASTELCCATAPRNFTVTAIGDSSFNVSWSEVDNADSYLLESMAPAGARCPSCPDWVSEGTFYSRGPHTISGFSPGLTYQFRVRAYGDGINLNSKLGDAATTSATTYIYPPPTPTGLYATPASVTEINLSWDYRDGVSKYQIEQRVVGSPRWTTVINNLAGSSTSYTVANLDCSSAEYEFRIRAYGDGVTYAARWGDYFPSPYPSAGTAECITTPPAPTGFTATAASATEVGLSWDYESGISKYGIDRRLSTTTSSSWTTLTSTLTGTSTSYRVSNLSEDTEYEFRVRAYGDAVTYESEWSPYSYDFATTNGGLETPPPPAGFQATADGNSVDLSWDYQSGISNYAIEQLLTTSSSWTTLTTTVTGTSYRVTDLSLDTEYEFRVRAYGDGTTYEAEWGLYSYGSVRTNGELEMPPAPTGFTATAAGETQVDLVWNYSDGNSNYGIEQRLNSSSWITLTTIVTGTSYRVTGLLAGTEYEFRVQAFGDGTTYQADWGPYSYGSARTDGELEMPPAPTGFTATAISETEVDLVWNYDGGISNYGIEQRLNSSSWTTLTINVTGTSYRLTGLSADTEYEFRVRAYGDGTTYQAEWGDYAHASARTDGELETPPAPERFTVTANDDTSFNVRWNSVTGTTDYLLEYLTPGGPRCPSCPDWMEIGTYPSGVTRTIYDFSPGTEYDFRVRAHGDGITYRSAWGYAATRSSTTHIYPPPAPTGFTATSGGNSIELSWDYRDGVSNYRIEQRLSTSSSWTVVTSTATGTSYNVSNLSLNTEYEFSVRAYGDGTTYEAEWSPYSYDSATTGGMETPPAPTGFTATAVSDTEVDLGWNYVSGISSYGIEQRLNSSSSWTTLTSTLTGASYRVSNLTADTEYQFRVRAYGDGTTYAAEWGSYSNNEYITTLQSTPTPEPSPAPKPTPGEPPSGFPRPRDCSNRVVVPYIGVSPRAQIEDCKALVRVVRAMGGTDSLNWSPTRDIRQWLGVGLGWVGIEQRVTSLNLSNQGLTGSIGSIIGDLTTLRTLDLSENGLTGSIPSSLSHLTQLRTLDLSENGLTGSIPSGLSSLARLQHLRLHDNLLSGSVPWRQDQMPRLQTLSLYSNRLTGQIPVDLQLLRYLRTVRLNNNQLSGEIPAGLGNPSLVNLDLSYNRLGGSIPADLGLRANLKTLNLSHNQLSEGIPSELGNLRNLQLLNLSNNQLIGEVPSALGSLPGHSLTTLYMSSNNFSECVPKSLAGALGSVPNHDLGYLNVSICYDRWVDIYSSANSDLLVTVACAATTPLPTYEAFRTLEFPNGFDHYYSAQIWAGTVPVLGQFGVLVDYYCVKGVINSWSEPGASSITWSGALHRGQYEWVNFDLTAIREGSWADFVSQRVLTGDIGRNDNPLEEPPSHSCTHCVGGAIHTDLYKSTRKFLKHDYYFVYGDHTFTSPGMTDSVLSDESWQVPVYVALPTSLSPLGILRFVAEFAEELANEFVDDLLEEQPEDTFRQWLTDVLGITP